MQRTTAFLIGTALLLLAPALPTRYILHAQTRITQASDAVRLETVWSRQSNQSGARYGQKIWGGKDLDGDGVADFGVYQVRGDYPATWFYYRGGQHLTDTAEPWSVVQFFGSSPGLIGNFLGGKTTYIVQARAYGTLIDDFFWAHDQLGLYAIADTGIIADEPLMFIDNGATDPPVQRFLFDAIESDINGDSISDLMLVFSRITPNRNLDSTDARQQLWIFLGGPEFRLDTPSVIIYDMLDDTVRPGATDYRAFLTDVDGDGRVDLMTSGGYDNGRHLVRFMWGDENAPYSWAERQFDRDVDRGPEVGLESQTRPSFYRVDAHPGIDFVNVLTWDNDVNIAYLYLSGRDSPRTRSFSLDNADTSFLLPKRYDYGGRGAYLNDIHRRFEMLPFYRPEFFGDPISWIFLSGGTDGPDLDYDAWTNEQGKIAVPVGDVTGDGWDDYGMGNENAGIVNEGRAAILSGGPHIPLDDTTLSVRSVGVAGDPQGLHLWPNPVEDRLEIAWRGDLRSMPATIEVYDVRGQLVTSSAVDATKGKASWICGEVAPGIYMLRLLDRRGAVIAESNVLKK